MSYAKTLTSLEKLLESFIEKAVDLKEKRLSVLSGINRLDDIACGSRGGSDINEDISEWFAEHNRFLEEDRLRPSDLNRIDQMLGDIKNQIGADEKTSPAIEKLRSEIDRWHQVRAKDAEKIVLKRPPEAPGPSGNEPTDSSITMFHNVLGGVVSLFEEMSSDRQHLLSVLDAALTRAHDQADREALLLSAISIYYLKLKGYKVEPYVRRLKEVERLLRKGEHSA